MLFPNLTPISLSKCPTKHALTEQLIPNSSVDYEIQDTPPYKYAQHGSRGAIVRANLYDFQQDFRGRTWFIAVKNVMHTGYKYAHG
jgi:hypothetical protein